MKPLTIKDPTTWSRVPGKMDTFLHDAGFLFAAASLQAHACGATPSSLASTTYVLFKPDAFAFGKAAPALDYLLACGFAVSQHCLVQLSEAHMLGLWRYQWNRATPERMAASLSIGALGPSTLVVLHDRQSAQGSAPAAARLWSLKGSASPNGRSPHSLRSVLGVQGRYFGYVHVPDEPADVVRELAVLLGTPAMCRLLAPTGHRTRGADPAQELRTCVLGLQAQFGLPWLPDAPPQYAVEEGGEIDGPATAISGYATACAPDFATAEPQARERAWLRLAACVPMLQDNRDGVRAIVESGGISDPASLWLGASA